ncbi:MAG: flagellar motor protein MotB [Thermomicrobiales bacterium]
MARRKPKAAEHVDQGRWLATYADLMNLMLIFFIILFAVSKTDAIKYQQITFSLQRAFNVDVLQGGEPGSIGDVDQGDTRFSEYLTIRSQIASLESVNSVPLESVAVELTAEGIVIHMDDAVLFPPGSAELRPDAMVVLDNVADVLGPLPNEIRVEGHTDDTQPDPLEWSSNWELSAERSVNVVRYLTSGASIPPERISAAAYGEFRPRVEDDTVEGRRLNRRVSFVIVAPRI